MAGRDLDMHDILQIILKPTARSLILIRVRFRFLYTDSFIQLIHRSQKAKKPTKNNIGRRTFGFATFFCVLLFFPCFEGTLR